MHLLRERRENLLQARLRQVRPRDPPGGTSRGPALTARPARRLFGVKCAQCRVGFSSSDLVMRARDSVYHVECFRCSVCSRQLLPGDEFSLQEHELLCRADHGLLLERSGAGSPRSPGPLPARGLHLPGERVRARGAGKLALVCFCDYESASYGRGRCVRAGKPSAGLREP